MVVKIDKLTINALIFPGRVGGTDATVADKRFLKLAATDGTTDGEFIQAVAGDAVLGVSSVPQGTEFPVIQTGFTPPTIPAVVAVTGDPIDVYMSQAPSVECGGTINAGQYVVSDADGRAVAATTGTGVNVAGVALRSAVAGGFIPVLLGPTTINIA